MGNADSQPIQKLQADLGYTFRNKELLKQALTHDSLRNSSPSEPTYQRLEFLGDTVIQLIITDYLYNKFPKYEEGALHSKREALVCQNKQMEIAGKLGLQDLVLVGDDSLRTRYRGWDNFVESLIGAIYIDAGGFERGSAAAKTSVYKLWGLQEA